MGNRSSRDSFNSDATRLIHRFGGLEEDDEEEEEDGVLVECEEQEDCDIVGAVFYRGLATHEALREQAAVAAPSTPQEEGSEEEEEEAAGRMSAHVGAILADIAYASPTLHIHEAGPIVLTSDALLSASEHAAAYFPSPSSSSNAVDDESGAGPGMPEAPSVVGAAVADSADAAGGAGGTHGGAAAGDLASVVGSVVAVKAAADEDEDRRNRVQVRKSELG